MNKDWRSDKSFTIDKCKKNISALYESGLKTPHVLFQLCAVSVMSGYKVPVIAFTFRRFSCDFKCMQVCGPYVTMLQVISFVLIFVTFSRL